MISEVLVRSSILSSHKHTLSTASCLPRFSTCSLSCTLLKRRVSAARDCLQLLGHSMCKFVVWSPTLTQTKSSLANQALSADPFAGISSWTHRIYTLVAVCPENHSNQTFLTATALELSSLRPPYFIFLSPHPPCFLSAGTKGMYHHA